MKSLARQICSIAATVLIASMLLGVQPALAQVGSIGATFSVKLPDSSGTAKRWALPSYDAADNAYLVVWGQIPIGARFVSADGVVLGNPVQVNTSGTYRQASAVGAACGPAACLVAWIEENPYEVVGRLVRYASGDVEFVTTAFSINLNGYPKHTESHPSVAYSSAADEFLVSWAEYSSPGSGWPDVKAQRVTSTGSLAGGEIAIAARSDYWEGVPSAAYNATLNEYMVAYYYEQSNGTNNVAIQRVQPGTGTLIGTRNTVYSSAFDQYPELSYNSQLNNYLAISWGFLLGTNNWMLHGHLVDSSGEPTGGTLSLAAQAGGNGLGLAYNPVRNTYCAVYQSQKNDEIWGVEISSAGAPGNQFQVTTTGATSSYFVVQPGVTANAQDGHLLAVSGLGYMRIIGQLVGEGGTTGGSTPAPGNPNPTPAPSVSCTTTKPGPDWVCDTTTGNWLPPSSGGTSGGTTSPCPSTRPGADWVCDAATGNWLPPGSGSTSGGGTSGGGTSACPTTRPGVNWVCDAATGNWLPPGSGGTSGGGTSGGGTSACPTTQPGAGWVCDAATGNWLPPGSGGTSGGGTSGGGTSACPSTRPGADWVCDAATGNWLPPGSGGTSGGGTSGGGTSACPTTRPGVDWVCDAATGNWLPPGSGGTSGGGTSACPTTRPGVDWVCDAATGNWLPPGSGGTSGGGTSACPTTRPGVNWVCDAATGNWLPPGSTGTTSACLTTKPGADWVCDASTGNWLPPTYWGLRWRWQ